VVTSAESGAAGGVELGGTVVAGPLEGAHRDPVRLDVIGVPVEAVGVVGHQHLRPDLADDAEQRVRRLATSARQKQRGSSLPAVPIMPESRHRPGPPRNRWSVTPSSAQARVQLADAVLPQPAAVASAR
jgi:hypothetical protein